MKLAKVTLLFVLGAFPAFSQEKPDSPQPKIQTLDERLNERYPDVLKLDTVEKSWVDAAKTPGMIIAAGMIFIPSIGEVHATNECLAAHTCREWNPLMRTSNGGRWALSMGVNAFAYWAVVDSKKNGHGVKGFCVATFAAAFRGVNWAARR